MHKHRRDSLIPVSSKYINENSNQLPRIRYMKFTANIFNFSCCLFSCVVVSLAVLQESKEKGKELMPLLMRTDKLKPKSRSSKSVLHHRHHCSTQLKASIQLDRKSPTNTSPTTATQLSYLHRFNNSASNSRTLQSKRARSFNSS